jgi:DNA-binding transcriptional LysR family regulator
MAQGVWAAELYAKYWYYRIIRPDMAAEARRVMDLPCDPRPEREAKLAREQAEVARLEAEEAKRPPPPPPRPGAPKIMSELELTRLRMGVGILPECSVEIEKAKAELRDIAVLPGIIEEGWVPEALLSFAYRLFGPPIVALVVGMSLIWALGWAFRGFRIG